MKQSFRLSPLTRLLLTTGILFLILFTLMRIGLYLYFNKQGYTFGQVWDAFLLGLRFDLRLVAIFVLFMLVLGNIPGLNPFRSGTARKVWTVIFFVVIVVVLFFFVCDFAHYSYLAQRLNASVLNYLEDAGISMNMVWESYPVIRLVAAIAIVAVLLWLIERVMFRRIYRNSARVSARQYVVECVVCFLIAAVFIFGRFGQYPLRWSDAYGLGSDYKANLALNPFESFFNTLAFRKNAYDPKKLKEYYPLLARYYGLDSTKAGSLDFSRTVNPSQTWQQTPNVVLIICESFSAYKSSSFGNPLRTTPFFDSLCNNGILFDRCFTPAYGTARGVWATLTGIPDVEAPATASRNPAAVDQRTIINAFTGHDKFYFLGGSTSWANIRGLLQNNIDGLKIYEQENFDVPKIDVWGISDKNLFLEANKILAAKQKPFFAIIQTADNHRPYTIPEEDLKEFKKINMPADSLRSYCFESLDEFNAYRYTDYCFQKFFEAASKEKYFSNTIFVMIGDHGIPGNADDVFPKVWTTQRLTQHHVPMLYYGPKFFSSKRVHAIASQVDVLPTLAGLCRIPYTNTSLGRDLLDSVVRKDAAFLFDLDNRQVGIIDSNYLFRKQMNTTRHEIFSITNNVAVKEDPAIRPRVDELSELSNAIYEAAKYLLLNNKKGKQR